MPKFTTSSLNTVGTPCPEGDMGSAMVQELAESWRVWSRQALNQFSLFLFRCIDHLVVLQLLDNFFDIIHVKDWLIAHNMIPPALELCDVATTAPL